ncbi:hypothetical protein SFRURICE_020106, partial [Spodoptera frugiperda]
SLSFVERVVASNTAFLLFLLLRNFQIISIATLHAAGLRTATKGSSPPDQNQTRAYGASRSARASKSQTTTDRPSELISCGRVRIRFVSLSSLYIGTMLDDKSHVTGVEPIAIYYCAIPVSVLLLRNFQNRYTLPDPGIEPETPCPAVTLAITRPTRQSREISFLIYACYIKYT